MKTINPQIQETTQNPAHTHTHTTLKHSIIKLLKNSDKEKILKATREYRYAIYRGIKTRNSRFIYIYIYETMRKDSGQYPEEKMST